MAEKSAGLSQLSIRKRARTSGPGTTPPVEHKLGGNVVNAGVEVDHVGRRLKGLSSIFLASEHFTAGMEKVIALVSDESDLSEHPDRQSSRNSGDAARGALAMRALMGAIC